MSPYKGKGRANRKLRETDMNHSFVLEKNLFNKNLLNPILHVWQLYRFFERFYALEVYEPNLAAT